MGRVRLELPAFEYLNLDAFGLFLIQVPFPIRLYFPFGKYWDSNPDIACKVQVCERRQRGIVDSNHSL